MDIGQLSAYALELATASATKTPIEAFTARDKNFRVEEAYAVQLINIRYLVEKGDRIVGKKIGLTSLAMQEMLGVDESDFGHLLASMNCADNQVNTDDLLQPKIEVELAFVLKSDLCGTNITVEDVVAATDYVVAAFEIVDSRIADWKIKLPDTVADNASAGCFILGDVKLTPDKVDLAACYMKLYKVVDGKDELINDGYGSAVLGDPRIAVAWLANKMNSFGVSLKAGEVILSGAFSAAPPAKAGDKFKAVFTDFGTLEAEFI